MKKLVKELYLKARGTIFSLFYLFTFLRRKKRCELGAIKKIFIIPLYRIGDTMVSIPVFRALKESLPEAEITVLANSYSEALFKRIPYVDRVITYRAQDSFLKRYKIIKKFREVKFDLGIDLTYDYTVTNAWLLSSLKADYTVGSNIYKRGFLFNRPVEPLKRNLHMVEILLGIVESIEVKTENKNLQLNISNRDKEEINLILSKESVGVNDCLVGIHPGAFYPTQKWPYERWSQVADKIIEKYSVKIILLGGAKEKKALEIIKTSMQKEAIVFSGQSLELLLAAIERCNLFLCNNSGPLHIACAVDTKTISTMGPTIACKWWPRGEGHIVLRKDLPCIACNSGTCRIGTVDCMQQITTDDMLEAVVKQLDVRL